jgi:ATP-binding cassette subfamily B protein
LAYLNIAQNFIISGGMIANLGMGVFDCYNGKLTPGDMAMLNVIFQQVMTPLNFMGTLMREVDETRVNLSFTIEMINKRESLTKEIKLPNFEFKGGDVEFRDVTYGYNQMDSKHLTKIILNKMNVKFEKGTINAIVGHSGNGKSTIFNLIV